MENTNERYSPVGRVIIQDESGNVIVDKNNMIVLAGRKKILSTIFSKDKFLEFSSMKFGSGTSQTNQKNIKLDCEIEDLTKNNISFILYTDGDSANILITEKDDTDATNLEYVEINGQGNNIPTISELGLFFKDTEDENKEVLFSRVTFEPVYLKDHSKYRILYYIYF